MKLAMLLRRTALVLMFVVLGIGAVTARVVVEGEQEMARSDRAFDEGDLPLATVHARRAAVLYAPGARHVPRALERLRAIALGAEAAGQDALARRAWAALRSAALEVRHFSSPFEDRLREADEHLARLATSEPSRREVEPGRIHLHARAEEASRRRDSPDAPWVVALVGGFAMTLAGLALFGGVGVTSDGEVRLGPARAGVLVGLVGVAVWVLAVLRA